MFKKIDYKWVIVALCILMVMVSLGFGSSTKSLFPDEMAKDLGIERSLISLSESFRYIATAVVNLFFGILIAKFGARKLIFAGFISLTAAMAIYAYSSNLILIYIAGALLGIGFSWTTTTMVGYVIDIWCKKNKGTIMGIVLASNGIGGAIAIQIAGGMIDPTVTGSYRDAYKMIALVLGITALILLLFFKDRPKNAETPPPVQNNSKKKSHGGIEWIGIDLKTATQKFYFWGALICIFCSGLILQGTTGISTMHFKDIGVDYTVLKSFLSFGSLILAGAKFICGFLYDKGGLRISASFCTIIAIISTVMLAFAGGEFAFVMALLFSLLSPFALPLETIMLPIYASDLFGQRSYANILGLFVSVNVAGYAIGGPVLNLSYDFTGSYKFALIIVSIIMILVFVLLQFVISAAHKERDRVIRENETV